MQRLFMTASGQSTCASPINNSQTTVVLQSTSGFPSPLSFQQFSAIILDMGNPAWNKDFPLATPYEYVFCTNNNTGTNTLTITRGQEGTTAKSFFAGATVAGVILPSDFTASFPQKLGENTLTGLSTTLGTFTVPGGWRSLIIKGTAQGNGAQVNIGVQFNGDVGNNYSYLHVFSPGSGAQGPAATVGNNAAIAVASNGSSATWDATIVNYASTALANKPVTSKYSTAGFVGILGGYWNQSVAITSLSIISSGNCVAGSFVEAFVDP